MKRFLIYYLLSFVAIVAPAQTDSLQQSSPATETVDSLSKASSQKIINKAEADSAYVQEDFQQAARLYQTMIAQQGESAQLYFNIGNCYYRMDSIAKAVLFYERARLLDPADNDIRFNLDMARAKTVDRVVPASEMFFVTAYRSLVLSMSITGWAKLGVAMFLLLLAGFALYLFAPQLRAKQVGFTVAIIALLVCIFSHIAANQQRRHIHYRTSAVIMSPSVVVKSTPSSSGTDLFILHEGTHVDIIDDSMREWLEIRMSDGKEGWLSRNEIEII